MKKKDKNKSKLGNHDITKVHNNPQVTKPKDIDIYNLPNKEFKIAVLMKFNDYTRKFRKIIQ